MLPRYYLISAVVVLVTTAAISIWKQKQTGKKIFLVLCQVVAFFALILGTVMGLAKLLAVLGIAQSGFIL